MRISRYQTIAILAFIIVLASIAYVASFQLSSQKAKYRGLITSKQVDLDESTRAYFEQRLASTQAAIAAKQQAGEDVDLNLYLSAASDAFTLGEFVTAREMLEIQLEGNSLNHVAWNNYALILSQMGDLELATNAYKKAVELSPDYQKYWSDYADFLMQHYPDQTEDLKIWYEASIAQLGQTNWNMVGLANVYTEAGDCDRALDHYDVAVSLNPENQALKDDRAALRATCK
jgi:tetratricopeptide (TPR) repeat protein